MKSGADETDTTEKWKHPRPQELQKADEFEPISSRLRSRDASCKSPATPTPSKYVLDYDSGEFDSTGDDNDTADPDSEVETEDDESAHEEDEGEEVEALPPDHSWRHMKFNWQSGRVLWVENLPRKTSKESFRSLCIQNKV